METHSRLMKLDRRLGGHTLNSIRWDGTTGAYDSILIELMRYNRAAEIEVRTRRLYLIDYMLNDEIEVPLGYYITLGGKLTVSFKED